jgi:hypothetical protein
LELRERLERLRHIIDRHLFPAQAETRHIPAVLKEALVEARRAFIVTLKQSGTAELRASDLKDLSGKLKIDATDRWEKFCRQQDESCKGRLSSQGLVAVLEETNSVRELGIDRGLRQGLGVCASLAQEWKARGEDVFPFGLSVRQQRQKDGGSFNHLYLDDPSASPPEHSRPARGLVALNLVGIYHETHPVERGDG